jgi:hypothetical protein
MKYFGYIRAFVVIVLAALFVSCASTSTSTASRRFQEGSSVTMVLRFYSWNSIYMTRPDTREGGFLPLMGRDEIGREVVRRNVPRDLAVVTIGSTYSPDQLRLLARDWKQFLAAQGFQRVVILRSGFKQEIDGLIVVTDSAIPDPNDTPGKTPSTLATVPAAPGPDVANSSITAIR